MSDDTGIRGLWDRIRHRKVVQWSLAYAAVAWGIVQVLEFAVSTFAWPASVTRIAAVVAATGLPVTIVLAWFHGDRGHQRAGRAELATLALLLVGGMLLVQRVATEPGATVRSADRQQLIEGHGAGPARRLDRLRIAVLPFANLGDDPANAGFVGGVHDTLITQVAKVPGLTVISRSSVLQFEGSKATIPEVAAALGVGTVLEGSVQREGQRLRIQAQLIDAANDVHLWAETYDRSADDLFAVQSEIARAVADQLRIRLSTGDSQRLAASMTSNPRAYEQYALGRSLLSRSATARTDAALEEAIAAFVDAVSLDPAFAAAHAQLGIARTWLAFQDAGRRKEMLPLAKASVEKALSLDPSLPEAHLARAVFLYRGEPDLPAATAEFETAIAGLPNDALAHQYLGYLRSYEGRIEDAVAVYKRAAELDPSGPGADALINRLAMLGRREEALAALANARAAQPENVEWALRAGQMAYDFDCDLTSLETALAALPPEFARSPQALHDKWSLALTVGEFDKAVEYVEAWAQASPGEDLGHQLGWAYTRAGRRAEAEKVLHPSLQAMLRELEALPSGDAGAQTMAFIARTYAFLGDHAQAARYANAAVAALPEAGAVRQKPVVLLLSASALARTGEKEQATELMRRVLELPFEVRPSGQWCSEDMEALRPEPAFRQMMAEHGADVNIDPHRRETWPKPRR